MSHQLNSATYISWSSQVRVHGLDSGVSGAAIIIWPGDGFMEESKAHVGNRMSAEVDGAKEFIRVTEWSTAAAKTMHWSIGFHNSHKIILLYALDKCQ